jgi:hypothetical protein
MSLTRWLRNLRFTLASSRMDRMHRRRPLRAATLWPRLELLEDRCTPSFSPAVSYPAGTNPQAVLTADFNGDTRLDLAVVNYNSSDVSVLLGNADGTFQTALTSPTGALPVSLAVGDFNGDGNIDLVTASATELSVLPGNGDGTFQAPTSIDLVSSPASVAVGDFNADGTLDLGVTSNVYHPGTPGYWFYDYGTWNYYPGTPGYMEGYANVLLGNGDGSFALTGAQSLGSGQQAASVAVGDFNKDDNLDLAATTTPGYYGYYYGTFSGRVNVLLGNGDGAIQAATGFDSVYLPTSVAAGDVNGDGNFDLVTANGWDNEVRVLLGDGLGAFGTAQNFAGGGGPVLGDFNGDGKPDIVTSNTNDGAVSVLLGTGTGSFKLPVVVTTGNFPLGVAAGDFNGDGWLDAVTANSYGTVSVLINDHAWPSEFAPYVSVNDVTVTEGNTGTVSAMFTLTLSAASDQAITVHYETADGSATADSDYASASGDLTFAAGQTSQTISIPVLGDRLAEPTEFFAVNLRSTAAFIGDGLGLGTILDDEPSVTIDDVTVTEGNTGTVNATFTLTLSAASDQALTVHYQTTDGSAAAGNDYAGSSGEVTFAAGATSQTISIPVFGDRLAEPTESFVVNISATAAFVGDGLGVCQILDDEPSVRINDVTVTEGNTGTLNAVFTVSLSAASDGPVTGQYESADQTALAGSDYQAAGGTVTFAAGELTRTITVLVNGDTLGELNETFLVNLSSLNAHVADGQGMGTILGDDQAFIWLNPWDFWLGSQTGPGGQSSASFGATGASGDVGPASAAASAFAQAWGNPGAPDESPSGSYFSAGVVFQRTLELVGSPTGWNLTLDALLAGTLFARSEYSAYSATSTVTAQVQIIQDATGAVTHDLNFEYGCTAYGGSRTLDVSAPGSREGLVADGTYTVIGSLGTSATGHYEEFVGSNQSYSSFWLPGLSATIDAVPWTNQPTVSISDATFLEGNTGTVTGYFTVALSNPWNHAVTVDFALADGSATLADNDYGYLDANRTVTFAPGVTEQRIAVAINGDRLGEPNETFAVNLSKPTNATIADGQGNGAILDDEAKISFNDMTVTEGNTGTVNATFTVTLSVAYDVPVTVGYATANGTS